MLEPGADAPEFTLENQHGEPVSLADLDRAVVYFYPRADTPGCTTEACGFRDSWDEFEEREVDVLGISDDPVSDLEAFAEEYDLPFELLSDPDGEVASAYDSYGASSAARNTYVVEDGEVTAAYEGISPDGHAEEILAELD
ncbi:peroxiredoxin [Halalkalicoccus tibetensis]|uniref:thioredoxin-dependent peroxiredoxin n=1 Tax=Halalkalicoccus tibetensis TaxID=175632 RepID=A0ABD5V459_9EURY